MNIMDLYILEPGAFYIMDRGYFGFSRLYNMHQNQCFFVIREKRSVNYKRLYSKKVDKELGFKCDQTIRLTGFYTSKKYPEKIRRIKYVNPTTGKTLIFLTNNIIHDSKTIALLYKERWKIEFFLNWIKQHLRIKKFYGTSLNAVHLQILSISLFKKAPAFLLITDTIPLID